MIIEFIFSTCNYLQKKKKTSNYDNLSNDYQKYIHQNDAVYYINVLMLSCKHY